MIEYQSLPMYSLIGGIQQFIARSLGLVVLDSDKDSPMVAHVEVVGPFQDLMP